MSKVPNSFLAASVHAQAVLYVLLDVVSNLTLYPLANPWCIMMLIELSCVMMRRR